LSKYWKYYISIR